MALRFGPEWPKRRWLPHGGRPIESPRTAACRITILLAPVESHIRPLFGGYYGPPPYAERNTTWTGSTAAR